MSQDTPESQGTSQPTVGNSISLAGPRRLPGKPLRGIIPKFGSEPGAQPQGEVGPGNEGSARPETAGSTKVTAIGSRRKDISRTASARGAASADDGGMREFAPLDAVDLAGDAPPEPPTAEEGVAADEARKREHGRRKRAEEEAETLSASEVSSKKLLEQAFNDGKPDIRFVPIVKQIETATLESSGLYVFGLRKGQGRVTYESEANRLSTEGSSAAEASFLVDVAREAGWECVKLAGSKEFREVVVPMMLANGVDVTGDDEVMRLRKAWLEAESERIQKATTTPAAETKAVNTAEAAGPSQLQLDLQRMLDVRRSQALAEVGQQAADAVEAPYPRDPRGLQAAMATAPADIILDPNTDLAARSAASLSRFLVTQSPSIDAASVSGPVLESSPIVSKPILPPGAAAKVMAPIMQFMGSLRAGAEGQKTSSPRPDASQRIEPSLGAPQGAGTAPEPAPEPSMG